jgi:hypothetical protein
LHIFVDYFEAVCCILRAITDQWRVWIGLQCYPNFNELMQCARQSDRDKSYINKQIKIHSFQACGSDN